MEKNRYVFNNRHRQNIRIIFESKTGVKLNKKQRSYMKHRLAAAVLAVLLCITVAAPVLAANVPVIYELMYFVSPGAAQFFKPVQISDIYDGIKLEVESAYIHENRAEIYVTLQDLSGSRIDSTTDLFDSYTINRPFDCTATCKNVGYDEETKTATFLISVTEWGNRDIEGDKITFSIREFLSQKSHYQDVEIPLDMSLMEAKDNTHRVYLLGGDYGGYSEDEAGYSVDEEGNPVDKEGYPIDADNTWALIPSEFIQEIPIEGIELTGMGYIYDQLHIQVAVGNSLSNDNHGFFYLKDNNGNTIFCNYSFSFSNQYEQTSQRIDYCEYVFDVPAEDVMEYSIYGDFVVSGSRTEGVWSVTFPLEQAE